MHMCVYMIFLFLCGVKTQVITSPYKELYCVKEHYLTKFRPEEMTQLYKGTNRRS